MEFKRQTFSPLIAFVNRQVHNLCDNYLNSLFLKQKSASKQKISLITGLQKYTKIWNKIKGVLEKKKHDQLQQKREVKDVLSV